MPEPIIDQPYNTTVKVGHTAQFLCKAKSAQSPLIKWLKEVEDPVAIRRRDPNATIVNASGMHLLVLEQTQVESISREGSEHLYTNRLVIPMVTKEHAGRYICVVTSTQGHIVYKAAQLNVVAGEEQLIDILTSVKTILLFKIQLTTLDQLALTWTTSGTS
ncbi:immunoglobulin I-set domain protein [Oesophagostomum dentatum]|uniref:receptor protein-tyrosine kinase n=1 Tax=Oesophagostomum dentatum TaxID=61180 RepID=A0A0B1T8C4_OESDE|nr:immunoglobulin I-set domain protein [Oesophagostomum dentatum]